MLSPPPVDGGSITKERGERMSTEAEDKKLTKRQEEVLGYLRQHCRTFGPTVREIAAALEITSPNGVVCHLRALERKGRIRRTPGISRGIEVLP
jgi:repressor LexA